MKLYKGWQVALAGMGINFLAGISYAWSIFAGELTRTLGWSQAQAALPYTVFIACYAVGMVIAGGIQDRIGPRPTITAGGILIGASFIISSFFMTPLPVAIIWGFLFGAGLACCFASVTPAAMKWFPAAKRGLVAGVVVGGIGLSAIVMAPFAHILVRRGVAFAFLICGVLMIVGISMLSRLVSVPSGSGALSDADMQNTDRYMVFRNRAFYIMWLMFCLTSATGLTLATHLDSIVRVQASFEKGYLMVALFALFNAVGRPAAGYLSDLLGRGRAMTVNFSVMTVMLLITVYSGTALSLAFAVSVLGLAYGGIYSLFPAAAVAYFGDNNFGLNYGLVFTAIGAAGFFPLVAGYLFDIHANFTLVFFLLAGFCALAVLLSLFLKNPAYALKQESGTPLKRIVQARP
ncbi:MAG: MFS transporter [Bacillota bacterium]|nr:MFS transporter [Bacillota bacterium]MDW7684849.1 MFS transporter [Bacillota bacterium]